MKIFDAFLFTNELDLLEIRLNELDSQVYKFIICESEFSFAGNKKETLFEKNKDRFSKFLDKIIYLNVKKFPNKVNSPEQREYYNRNYLINGIPIEAGEEDIFILSDVDEIPKIENLNKNAEISVFRQDMYYFNTSNKFLSPLDHANWHGSIAFKIKLKNLFSLQQLRFNRYNIQNIVQDGGWHFSYFSDAENVLKKIKNGGHSEMISMDLNEQTINSKIKNGQDVLGRNGYVLEKIKENQNIPKFMLENKEKYKLFFEK